MEISFPEVTHYHSLFHLPINSIFLLMQACLSSIFSSFSQQSQQNPLTGASLSHFHPPFFCSISPSSSEHLEADCRFLFQDRKKLKLRIQQTAENVMMMMMIMMMTTMMMTTTTTTTMMMIIKMKATSTAIFNNNCQS